MPPVLVLIPPALLAVAALACWGVGRADARGARVVAAAATWLAAAAVVVLWTFAGRQAVEFEAAQVSLAGVPFGLRLDAVSTAFCLLLAVVAVLASGVLPMGTWLPLIWARPRLEAGSLALSVLVPLGFLLLVRTYGLGGGRWPGLWLNLLLALLGTATALGAALRG